MTRKKFTFELQKQLAVNAFKKHISDLCKVITNYF